jgi:putative transposase
MRGSEMITRGDLPHWYMPGAAHFVTYRLAATLPEDALCRMRADRDRRLGSRPPHGVSVGGYRARCHKQFFAHYDRYLDQVSSIRWLEDPKVAAMIVENLYHHHEGKYHLLDYTVMPNHVHVLLVPIEKASATDAGTGGLRYGRWQPRYGRWQRPPREWPPRGGENPGDDLDCDCFSDELDDTRSPLSSVMHSLKSYTANEANKVLGRTGRFWQRESYDHWVRDDAELQRIAEYIAENAVRAGLAGNPWEWPYCSAHDRKHPRSKQLAKWW